MSPFRRVEARQAGAEALGILVPPGQRTLVVMRPRSLSWDLLPAHWAGEADQPPTFCVFSRDEAAGVARRVLLALESAVAANLNPLQTIGDPQGRCFQLWLRTEEYVWIVCRRTPGQSYQPALFTSYEETLAEAERLTPIVWPMDRSQEVYFNTQQFHANSLN